MNCQQNVKPTKKFSWLWFLLWCCAGGIGGFVYLCYFWFIVRKNKCPICGDSSLQFKKSQEKIAAIKQGAPA